MWDEALLFLVPFWCQIFDAFIVLRWATVAHMGLLLIIFCKIHFLLNSVNKLFKILCNGDIQRVFFSSPEPKARVSYCHSAPSVVRPSSVNFHIFDFFSRTAWWILMKLGRDEVLMVPYKCCCFLARSAQGRIQGGAKIGHGGSPSSRNFFFRPEGYSDKPNA